MLDIKEFGPQHTEEFFFRIAELLIRHELTNASLTFSQNLLGYKILRGVISFAISEDELNVFTSGKKDIAEGRWWFALPDEVTRQLVIDLQENGSLVIVAINQFRYPVHAHELLVNRDIQRMIETGVDGLQIDSAYDELVDQVLGNRRPVA